VNALIPMQSTLRELESALTTFDPIGIGSAVSRLVAPLGAIYASPRPVTPHAQKHEDQVAGPVSLQVQRCLALCRVPRVHAGLRGVPWDGRWLEKLLEFILAIIGAVGPLVTAAPGGSTAVLAEAPPDVSGGAAGAEVG
jgi:hypothetical protein